MQHESLYLIFYVNTHAADGSHEIEIPFRHI